jgi:hypothetical protein
MKYVNQGDWEKGVLMSENPTYFPDPHFLSKLLFKLSAVSYSKNGTEEALKLIAKIPRLWLHDQAINQLLQLLMNDNKISEAQEVAEKCVPIEDFPFVRHDIVILKDVLSGRQPAA